MNIELANSRPVARVKTASASPCALSFFNLNPRRIGGMETYARELSLQLGEYGWRSVLCFLNSPGPDVRDYLLSAPNTQLDVESYPAGWSSRSIASFIRLIRRHRPQLVHLHFTGMFGPYAALAKRLGVRDVFLTDHTSRPEHYRAEAASAAKRALYRTCWPVSGVICVSQYVRDCWLAADLLSPEKLLTVYNGADLDVCEASSNAGLAFRKQFSLPKDAIVVTQIANMIEEKGFADLLKAASKVVAKNKNIRFVLAGEGRQRGEYEALVSRLNLEQHVTFTGLLEDPIRQGVFAGSDVICQASRWNEAFGFVIAEAMACGKPVIATRVGGIPEVVEDQATGVLVQAGDTDALAREVLRVAGDAVLREEMGRRARHRCRRLFDHRQNVAQLIQHYRLQSAPSRC
jgi:L-malate glycosyltransferase